MAASEDTTSGARMPSSQAAAELSRPSCGTASSMLVSILTGKACGRPGTWSVFSVVGPGSPSRDSAAVCRLASSAAVRIIRDASDSSRSSAPAATSQSSNDRQRLSARKARTPPSASCRISAGRSDSSTEIHSLARSSTSKPRPLELADGLSVPSAAGAGIPAEGVGREPLAVLSRTSLGPQKAPAEANEANSPLSPSGLLSRLRGEAFSSVPVA
mmetsp:Transcript_13201/g.37210  ORF Transcript_13201/g.37210 Transcript_13201/m.37210 type:complete len:215 (-) Transcript_13201:5540-6184(-)